MNTFDEHIDAHNAKPMKSAIIWVNKVKQWPRIRGQAGIQFQNISTVIRFCLDVFNLHKRKDTIEIFTIKKIKTFLSVEIPF